MSEFPTAENKAVRNPVKEITCAPNDDRRILKVLKHSKYLQLHDPAFRIQERIKIIHLSHCDSWTNGQAADKCTVAIADDEQIQSRVPRNMMVHHRVHMYLQKRTLSQIYPVHTLTHLRFISIL
jgi:hypothetical protein